MDRENISPLMETGQQDHQEEHKTTACHHNNQSSSLKQRYDFERQHQVAIVTGIMISSTLGFTFSLETYVYNAALDLHIGSSGLSLLLIGLHIAVDWKWIVANTKKYLFPYGSPRAKPSEASREQSN